MHACTQDAVAYVNMHTVTSVSVTVTRTHTHHSLGRLLTIFQGVSFVLVLLPLLLLLRKLDCQRLRVRACELCIEKHCKLQWPLVLGYKYFSYLINIIN